ncbi:MAG: hypothetical protein LBL59_03665 [Xanthomonadaceae bacterium]|jgi:hypothetical protein|nr:hypothetical protein [Xanthomonadaceae bacterium]
MASLFGLCLRDVPDREELIARLQDLDTSPAQLAIGFRGLGDKGIAFRLQSAE